MKKNLLFACILMLLIIPSQVFASDDDAFECSNQLASKYRQIAANINVSTTYREENGGITFQVIITNLTPDITVQDLTRGTYYTYGMNPENPSEVVIDGYAPGRSYRFIAYATNQDDCEYGELYTYYVNTPSYNPYYNDAVCKDAKEYKLCQKWLKTSLNHDAFVKEVTAYKDSLKKEESKKVKGIETPSFNLAQFFIDYYYVFLIIIILFCIGAIYWNEKRDTFGF